MGCLKLTYSAENDAPNWKVWTAESSEKEVKGLGDHWSDGIRYSDWSSAWGSDTYREGLAMGLTDLGGQLYRVNSDGSRDLYEEHGGQMGFYTNENYHTYSVVDGKLVKNQYAGVRSRFVSVDENGWSVLVENDQDWVEDERLSIVRNTASFMDRQPQYDPNDALVEGASPGSVARVVVYSVAKQIAKGGKQGIRMMQFTKSTIDDAFRYASTPRKLEHLFAAKHKLGPLVKELGGRQNTLRAILNSANGKFPASGVFRDLPVNVNGYIIYLRGSVHQGIPKIGTMFIK